MRQPPEPKQPVPFHVCYTEHFSDAVHPGWVRATAILLRGLARLQQQNAQKPTIGDD